MKKPLWPTIKSFRHQAVDTLANMLIDNSHLQSKSKIRLPDDINDFGRYTLEMKKIHTMLWRNQVKVMQVPERLLKK